LKHIADFSIQFSSHTHQPFTENPEVPKKWQEKLAEHAN
jgi:hypothetical protein